MKFNSMYGFVKIKGSQYYQFQRIGNGNESLQSSPDDLDLDFSVFDSICTNSPKKKIPQKEPHSKRNKSKMRPNKKLRANTLRRRVRFDPKIKYIVNQKTKDFKIKYRFSKTLII